MPQVSRKQTQSIENRIIAELETLPDRRVVFTNFENDMIRRFYATKGSAALARVLKKTNRQISNRAHDLGLKLKSV